MRSEDYTPRSAWIESVDQVGECDIANWGRVGECILHVSPSPSQLGLHTPSPRTSPD